MKHVGILGGTFDIVHNGHLEVAHDAVVRLGLDKVTLVTAGQPPHKQSRVTDGEIRHELVEAAVAGHPHFEASRVELDRPGLSYTYQTVLELKAHYSALFGEEVKVSFILSAEYLDPENPSNLATWEEVQLLLAEADLIVVPRGKYTAELAQKWARDMGLTNATILAAPVSSLSSGVVRDALRQGLPIDAFVPSQVAERVKQRGLCYR
jgi:nicotinate-nucleotide adenylyltransferase